MLWSLLALRYIPRCEEVLWVLVREHGGERSVELRNLKSSFMKFTLLRSYIMKIVCRLVSSHAGRSFFLGRSDIETCNLFLILERQSVQHIVTTVHKYIDVALVWYSYLYGLLEFKFLWGLSGSPSKSSWDSVNFWEDREGVDIPPPCCGIEDLRVYRK